MQTDLNAVVTEKHEIAPDLMVIRVKPVDWNLPTFEAGQYVVLGLPGSAPRVAWADPDQAPTDSFIRRAYSIASSSLGKDYLEFYVTLVRSGLLTPRLFALEEGDGLWLGSKIVGMFTLKDVPEDQDIVLVATGTGIAPYMSMLRTYSPTRTDRRVAVLQGARHSWDLGYRSELFTLERDSTNFAYLPLISRPAEETVPWKGRVGYVQDLWTGGALTEAWGKSPTPEDTHVFLCGNPAMCEGMLETLQNEGFREHKRREPGQIHVEKYW